MRRKYKRFSFCVESVLCCFFFRMAMTTEWESLLNLSQMLSCGFGLDGIQFDFEQSLLFPPPAYDCKTIDVLRNWPTPTHSVAWWDTFSCSQNLSGFHGSTSIHHLIFVIIFATHLHVDKSRNWLKEGSWGSQPTWACGFDYARQNPVENSCIWEFYGRVGHKIPHRGQIEPAKVMRSG